MAEKTYLFLKIYAGLGNVKEKTHPVTKMRFFIEAYEKLRNRN